jgi:hypothetical protein
MFNKVEIITVFVALLLLSGVSANTIKTPMDGVVLKRFYCSNGNSWEGTLVNNSDRFLHKQMCIKSFDSDGDPIGACESGVSLNANSGEPVFFAPCNCANATSVRVTFGDHIGVNPFSLIDGSNGDSCSRPKIIFED